VSGNAPDLGSYCRQIESYLCRRNGGHLVRIVGPAFEKVAGWGQRGVPLKVVFKGIDRYVQRQADRGAARRPVRIEFCEGDVLDVFDEWRRAVGTLATLGATMAEEGATEDVAAAPRGRGPSLPAHIERVQLRLSSLLAGQPLAEAVQLAIGTIVGRLDAMHAQARTARGDAREALLTDLRGMDTSLMSAAWDAQDAASGLALRDEASADLAPFRERMTADTWQASVEAAATRLLRERLGLPTLALD
jgi:hypothetical protein